MTPLRRRGLRRPPLALAGCLAACVAVGACMSSPPADVTAGQTLIELSDAMNALRQDNAILQAELDSLRTVVARQDTLVRRLAELAGVPVPAP